MSGATTLHRTTFAIARGPARKTTQPHLAGRFFEVWTTVELWLERARQRRQLRQLDERMLRDIGISRADADYLGRLPFWKEWPGAIGRK